MEEHLWQADFRQGASSGQKEEQMVSADDTPEIKITGPSSFPR